VTSDRGKRTSREHIRPAGAGRGHPPDLLSDRDGGWPRSEHARNVDDERERPSAVTSECGGWAKREHTRVASGGRECALTLPTERGGWGRRDRARVVGNGLGCPAELSSDLEWAGSESTRNAGDQRQRVLGLSSDGRGWPAGLGSDRRGWAKCESGRSTGEEPESPLCLASERGGSARCERRTAVASGWAGWARHERVQGLGDGSRLEMR
jgi:hypothetical protein